jgi:hypothetical protein
MTARQLLQRRRQSTESTTRNAIYRRSALTATTTTAQRHHITELATLHEDSIAATIALKSVLTGVQAAAAVAAPIEGAVTSGFSNEANQMLDQNVSKAKSLESIYVHERTSIRIFVMRRFIPDAGQR